MISTFAFPLGSSVFVRSETSEEPSGEALHSIQIVLLALSFAKRRPPLARKKTDKIDKDDCQP
jgi:hypothetical protein